MSRKSVRKKREISGSAASTHRKGFTLLELLVGTVLMVLIFGMFFQFLIPGMKTFALGQTRVEIQQEALRTLQNIASDMDLSVSSGVSLFATGSDPETGPVYIGIMRLDEVSSDGDQVWDNTLVVYSWQGSGYPVVRKVWAPGYPPSLGITLSAPSRFPQSVLQSIASEPNLQGQVLARDVTELKITTSPPYIGTSIIPPVIAIITIKRDSASGRVEDDGTPKKEIFKMERSMSFRNHL